MTMRPLLIVLAAAAACGAYSDPAPDPGGLQSLGPRASDLAALLEARRVVVDAEALESNVIEALVAALDPDGGAVLDPDRARQRHEEDLGRFYGIGCAVQLADRRLQIVAVHSNSPAESAGLQVSNVIVRIDGRETDGLSLEEAVARLRGGRDEPLSLAVRAGAGSEACRTVTVARAAVQMPVTGTQETWPQGVGYLKVNGLYPDSGARIAEQLGLWRETNVFGVILDLRGAGGADLDSAAAVGSLFVPEGEPLLTVRDGRGETVSVFKAVPARPLAKPVMVLVDGETRGAAEALAALLRGAPGALLIGLPTRGDDRLREVVPLSETRALYIATRRIETARGPAYRRVGVQPHVTVDPAGEPAQDTGWIEEEPDLFAENADRRREDRMLLKRVAGDPVLQRAADILLGLKALDVKVR